MLPEIKESLAAYEPEPRNLFDLTPVKKLANAYLP